MFSTVLRRKELCEQNLIQTRTNLIDHIIRNNSYLLVVLMEGQLNKRVVRGLGEHKELHWDEKYDLGKETLNVTSRDSPISGLTIKKLLHKTWIHACKHKYISYCSSHATLQSICKQSYFHWMNKCQFLNVNQQSCNTQIMQYGLTRLFISYTLSIQLIVYTWLA